MVRRDIALLLVAILGLSFVMPSSMTATPKLSEVSGREGMYRTSYVSHAPFNITSEADFVTMSFPGNGSETDPYLIQGLNITSSGSSCIWVMNTASHFIIEDCLFTSAIYQYPAGPVTLTNVSNGVVRENHIHDSFAGIAGYNLSQCVISDNILSVEYLGITITSSNFTLVTNNTQGYEPCGQAVIASNCRNCTISLNVFKNITSSGISVFGGYDVNVTKNRLYASTGELAFTWSGIELRSVRSCLILENTVANFSLSGLDVRGTDCLIADNNVTDADVCMKLSLNNSIVRDNYVSDGFDGLALVQTNFTSVYGNTIYGRRGYYEAGIAVHGGIFSEIFSNNISRVYIGIYLQGSSELNVSSNIVSNGRYGFAFGWYSNWDVPEGPFANCSIVDNVFDSGGIYPLIEYYSDWEFHTITFEGNTVNGGDIGFFAEVDGYAIDGNDYTQILLVSCNRIIVSGGDFSGILSDRSTPYYDPGQASAITLLNCSECTLEGANVHNNTIGVNLQDCTECNVTGCLVDLNTWRGISIDDSTHIRVSGVDISSSPRGIEISSSHSCQITGSTITENEEGIVLRTSYNCLLSGSMFFENGDAILLDDADGTDLNGNVVYWNDRGILLNSTSDCLITENNVYNNTGVGISLTIGSNLNDIFNNTFAFNSPNAICEGTSNHWDNQVDTGNQWSDYGGEGPYVIDENDQDNYPSIIITTTTTPTDQGGIDPLFLAAGGGVIGLIALVIIVADRRRTTVVE